MGHIRASSSSVAPAREVKPYVPRRLELRLGTGEVMENSEVYSNGREPREEVRAIQHQHTWGESKRKRKEAAKSEEKMPLSCLLPRPKAIHRIGALNYK